MTWLDHVMASRGAPAGLTGEVVGALGNELREHPAAGALLTRHRG